MKRKCFNPNCGAVLSDENPLPFCNFDCEIAFEDFSLSAVVVDHELENYYTHETESNYAAIGNGR
jgi:hypothetical protein